MVKMIFSDFDGTLLNYRKEKYYLDEYQLSVLIKLKEKGIKFCIVTGRGLSFFKLFPALLEVVDYIIGSNGGFIYDVVSDKVLYLSKINNSILDNVVDYAIDNKVNFLMNCFDKGYSFGDIGKGNIFKYNKENEYECEQIILSFDNEKYDEVLKYVNGIDELVINNVGKKPNSSFFDINNIGVSKGNSIMWLCKYLNILKDEIVGFGDGENDLSMFRVVGKSVAVSNANDKLKEIADIVVDSCYDDGVYKYIEENILK